MKIMLSAKYAVTAIGIVFIFLFMVFNAYAQWSPGGEMVYMGDLNLAAPSVSGATAPQAVAGSQINHPSVNNSTINNMTAYNSSINNSSMENSTIVNPSGLAAASGLSQSTGMKTLDLSSYSRDRTNKNLAGYKNIMYPISGSRGTTTSTSGGGGGGGCGCG
jgi:hypothetical protein